MTFDAISEMWTDYLRDLLNDESKDREDTEGDRVKEREEIQEDAITSVELGEVLVRMRDGNPVEVRACKNMALADVCRPVN